jgi:hypothetical protein
MIVPRAATKITPSAFFTERVPSSTAPAAAQARAGRARAADAKTARRVLIPIRSIRVRGVRPLNGT